MTGPSSADANLEHLMNGTTIVLVAHPSGKYTNAGTIDDGTYLPSEWIEDYTLTPTILRTIADLIEGQ